MATDYERLPLSQAAKRLGITTDALKKRIRRKTVEASKDADGRWWVLLPAGLAAPPAPAEDPDLGEDEEGDDPRDQLLAHLETQVQFLQEQLEAREEELARRDQQINALLVLLQRATTPPPKPPWWRRLFGAQAEPPSLPSATEQRAGAAMESAQSPGES